MNPKSLPNLFAGAQWKQLPKADRHAFGQEYVRSHKSSTASMESLEEVLSFEENRCNSIYFRLRMDEMNEEEKTLNISASQITTE